MSMHSGHRERLKDRYRQDGLDNFPPVNVLEMLLFYCIPRKDTNPIAHRLLEHFGSLHAVLNANPMELKRIDGVSDNAALFLTMLPDAFRYYRKDGNQIRVVKTTQDCCDFLENYFIGQTEEVAYLLCLDAKCKILCCREVGRGSVNATSITFRSISDVAINSNASSVVLAHNHPSGLAMPSAEDVRTTHKIASALMNVGVILSDHLIFSEDDCVSLRESGFYDPSAVE